MFTLINAFCHKKQKRNILVTVLCSFLTFTVYICKNFCCQNFDKTTDEIKCIDKTLLTVMIRQSNKQTLYRTWIQNHYFYKKIVTDG